MAALLVLRKDYMRVKQKFAQLGRRAQGKPSSSAEYIAYEKAKREYHRAGEALRRASSN